MKSQYLICEGGEVVSAIAADVRGIASVPLGSHLKEVDEPCGMGKFKSSSFISGFLC